MTRQIPWLRVVAEGVVIVVSKGDPLGRRA